MVQFQNNSTKEVIVYSLNNDDLITAIKQDVETEELNNDVSREIAVFNYLVQLHKEKATSEHLINIQSLYYPDIYPGDTVKYIWDNETLGGMVFSVNHTIDILPGNKYRGITNISYSPYTMKELLDLVSYQNRPLYGEL